MLKVNKKKVYDLIKEKGLTNHQMAENAGITRSGVSIVLGTMEKRGTLQLRTVITISNMLNVSPNDLLLEETDEKKNYL